MERVLVGMSGGIDSSLTAYILKEMGYEVEGLSFVLWETRGRTDLHTCCSFQAIGEAAKTAAHIGIPHHVSDVRVEFLEKVIEPFIDAYRKGSTPNPCILCNQHVKFPFLLREADLRGIDRIATGHYAEVMQGSVPGLGKGADRKKDQSYFLYILTGEELKRLVLPLAQYTKDKVRARAHMLKLPAANRRESQEICFVEGNSYQMFLRNFFSGTDLRGPIVNSMGERLGTHKGLFAYTIGQRKGIGIPAKKPLYVVRIDTKHNELVVGTREEAMRKEFLVNELNWIVPADTLFHGGKQNSSIRAEVKFRSTMTGQHASLSLQNQDRLQVKFDEPQWAPARGQSVVFYHDNIVLGGGVIVL